ncbi:hypothetical protein LCGC14_0503960 [marine sediment metagenome]|uniref:NAD-dependent epimerase/dehydratase domain-containing protein n=1 Tax=marine sediment metagenome TaxID=412755 RepID=A0A0F9UPV7_9ZZZZ
MMKILVTGGSGFVGGAIIKNLLQQSDAKIMMWDNRLPKNPLGCYFIKCDITEELPTTKPYDLVFHCAGLLGTESLFKNIKEATMVNIMGTLNILELHRDHGFIVQLNILGDWLNPYMISKRAAENYGLMYRKWYNTRYVSVRPTVIYGPGQSMLQKKVAPTFINAALRNEPIPIYGDGSYMMPLLFVKDVASYIVAIGLNNFNDYAKIDIGSLTHRVTVKELAELVISLTGSTSKLEYKPMRIGQPLSAKDAGANLDLIKGIEEITPFNETPLEVGLQETINYYKGLM